MVIFLFPNSTPLSQDSTELTVFLVRRTNKCDVPFVVITCLLCMGKKVQKGVSIALRIL